MTKEEVFKLLVLIESVYPNCVIKNDMVLHWFKLAPFLDYQTLIGRLHSHIRKCPYPPSLQDLSEARKKLMHDANHGFMQKSISSWMQEYSIR
ncbi:hypothetical protein QE429_002793 [Bacillus sp. SORGH_AS 510]|uniref:hypothetical protein n=1 Tax=Bacillus sp. SORGH_AS_0510 TaxID=3041771 RepID=UPI0027821B01|nr:hypothetical protein [Bacillus sp. SORGH_AS_0510]MDQ1145966.1 hypothetical protein [Bacillus sp. SORGH_AS_0510]